MPENSEPEAAKLFLSYERKDEEAVEELYQQLKAAGYQPWMDRHDILPGQRWSDAIKKAVKESDFFLPCLSPNSVDKRGIIQKELRYALDRLDEALDSDIYLIPVRLQDMEIPEVISEFQWVDLFNPSGFERLVNAIEAQGFPGIHEAPTPMKNRWTRVRSTRRPVLDLIVPTYILDTTYHFMDWNPAFDLVVAQQTGIARGEHGLEFIRNLENCQQVIERSKDVFGPGKDPLVDIEELRLNTDNYGLVRFQKVATVIADDQGNPMAWCVNLNILDATREDGSSSLEQLWSDLSALLDNVVNWSRYAVSYDKLLVPFDDYQKLINTVVNLIGEAQVCADLGAGTGNGTLALLAKQQVREVWAVENNEAMLEYLRDKVGQRDREESGKSTWGASSLDSTEVELTGLDRLTIVKEDLLRIDDIPAEYFDAAILINVLYTIDDRVKCIRQANRILRLGGVLVLSTPSQETNLGRLFGRMREVLQGKELFDELKANFEGAQQVHEKLHELIHRDSPDDIRGYLESNGFEIDEWLEGEYVGSVVVIKARKIASC
jgi:SAM-dependent methyltransferase